MSTLNPLISGAIMMGFFTISLFFARFWKKTADILFLMFSISFFIMGVERAILALYYESEFRPFVYILRLLAFTVIILAVIYKNMSAGKNSK